MATQVQKAIIPGFAKLLILAVPDN